MPRPMTLLASSLALTVLVGGLAVSPCLAATPKGTSTSSDSAVMAPKDDKSMPMEKRVEERVKELHDKLKITSDQADAWNVVADAMRENGKDIHALIEERHEKAGTLSALDDLDSYRKIASAHADGIGKFIQAFQPLYDSMTDAQKKNADTVFGSYEGHMGHMGSMAKHGMHGGKNGATAK
jgi:hypothetical protein